MKTIPPWMWIAGGIALVIALTTGDALVNQVTTQWLLSANAQKWQPVLASIETALGIPPGLLARIAYQESHFRQSIIDGSYASSTGALGLMQLEPQYFNTVQRPTPFSDADTTDQINEAGTFLVQLYRHYSNWTDAVAAYNAGQRTIDEVIAGTRNLPAQTATYIREVSSDLPTIVNPTLSA